MTPSLEADLVDRFPHIFAINSNWRLDGVEHYPIDCGDGWYSLIENTCNALTDLAKSVTDIEIDTAGLSVIAHAPWLPKACVFCDRSTGQEGFLRFDLDPYDRTRTLSPLTNRTRFSLIAEGMAWMACQISESVCEVCGAPGRYSNKRVRCLAHVDVSTEDAQRFAERSVAYLVARAANPKAKLIVTKTPTRKRPPPPT